MISNKTSFVKLIVCIALTAVLLVSGIFVSAANTTYSQHTDIPYDTYTYWKNGGSFEPVYTKPLYKDAKVITAFSLGITDFKSLVDVTVDSDGYTYLLDSENSRVVILDNNYNLFKEITNVGEYTFAGAKGLFVSSDKKLYIADTLSARILITDKNGDFHGIMTLPDSPLIPDDFVFAPSRLTVDMDGYTYVLSDGSYYGAILYSPKGEFLSFYGANVVEGGITSAITNLWEKLTMTNEKRAKQASKLPYQFTDLYVDKDNFIYTSTGKTKKDSLQTGVVRMLSPGGNNVLASSSVVFGEKELLTEAQNIAGLAIDDYGFIYVYDTVYSRIYLYDSECNMFCAFGSGFNSGSQDGTFKRISAIDLKGDDVLITDDVKNTLTVFECNDYGKNLKKLQRMTLDGDYLGAKAGWQEINIADSNNQLAYIALAKAAYTEGDYKKAIELSKIAYDRDTYSQAYEQIRKEFLSDNFSYLAIIVIAIVAGIFLIAYFLKRKNINLIKNEKTKLFFSAVLHPAATFTDIKQKKLCSMKWSLISLVLFYVSVATQEMFGSFVFVNSSAGSFNSILLLVKTVGFVVLWTIANWGVCSLFGGIGKAKEIFTVITYSLTPVIVYNFIYTLLTHFLIPQEAAFLSVISAAVWIYAIAMIIIGSIIIHDFSFGKFVGTTILTVFGMAIVIFVGVLIIILVQQLVAFIVTIFNELVYK